MNYQGSPTKRPLREFFSFTRWGLLFFSLSLVILIIGVLRMELAAILWGCAFTLLAVYCLLANRIMQAVLRRFFEKIPDPVDFALPAEGVFPRSLAAAELNAELPRYRAPGIKIGFETLLHWPGRDPLRLKSDLSGGRNRRTYEFFPPYRGCYQSREIHIVVGDLLGFTSFPVTLVLAERLRVFPAVHPETARLPPSLEGGQEDNRRRRQRRSEELLEVRKYFPGDDIRKVHWKVFAHTSELFLRIGEETPPPKSRFLVILDSAPTQVVPARVEADYLDVLVEICAATVLEMLARGFQVYFARCDSPQPRQVTLEQKRRLLSELAGVCWSDGYTLELPPRHLYQILLLSSPGSGNLPRLFGELEKRGGEVRLFFADLSMPAEESSRRGARYLFLRPPAQQSRPSPLLESEELEVFRNEVDREIARWSRRGKWKVAVEIL